MTFDEMDKQMRVYEQSLDQIIVPGIYIVARLDGRGFTKLTKEICEFEAPFDIKFRDLMIETVVELMQNSGFKIIYGYTESDEISLLFDIDDNTFNRKVRKINTTLAGIASAKFSMRIGILSTFDCRVVPLPNKEKVIDYFMWRQEDSHRNSLNSWCYWTLRKEGYTARQATKELCEKSVSYKNELLFQRGINFNDLPVWQRRGSGVYFKEYYKDAKNPITGDVTLVKRKQLCNDFALSYGDEYRQFINNILK